jgi:hypothetical protein
MLQTLFTTAILRQFDLTLVLEGIDLLGVHLHTMMSRV